MFLFLENLSVIFSKLHELEKVEEASSSPKPKEKTKCYFDGEWKEVPVFDLPDLKAGAKIDGPALIIDKNSTIILESEWVSLVQIQ